MDPESGEMELTTSTMMDLDGIDEEQPTLGHSTSQHRHHEETDEEDNDASASGSGNRQKKRNRSIGGVSQIVDNKVKIALSLYKVQQSIYLLDFQRVEVSHFGLSRVRFYVPCVSG